MIERSKRTGRFLPARKHRKKTLTRAQEAKLYYSMAERYLVLAVLAAPVSWTLRRAGMPNVVWNVVKEQVEWGFKKDGFGLFVLDYPGAIRAIERRLERLGIKDWGQEKRDAINYKRKRRR